MDILRPLYACIPARSTVRVGVGGTVFALLAIALILTAAFVTHERRCDNQGGGFCFEEDGTSYQGAYPSKSTVFWVWTVDGYTRLACSGQTELPPDKSLDDLSVPNEVHAFHNALLGYGNRAEAIAGLSDEVRATLIEHGCDLSVDPPTL